jgi:hypothetical protein
MYQLYQTVSHIFGAKQSPCFADGYCKSPNETGSSTIEATLGYSSNHPLTVDVARPSAGGDFLAAAG